LLEILTRDELSSGRLPERGAAVIPEFDEHPHRRFEGVEQHWVAT
jgi:hypothetical protein